MSYKSEVQAQLSYIQKNMELLNARMNCKQGAHELYYTHDFITGKVIRQCKYCKKISKEKI